MSIVAWSGSRRNTEIFVASRRPSPLGENTWSRLAVMRGGVLLSRWATKKAANVAATRTTKVIWATTGIAAEALLGALVLPKDHDHVPVLAGGLFTVRQR